MNDLGFTVILGCVSGMITAAILLVIKNLFVNSLIPWYRSVMYEGSDISGEWHSSSMAQKTLLELDQKCQYISGKATINILHDAIPSELKSDIHLDDIRTFDVSGEVFERFVRLTLKHTDRKKLGITTYLFQLQGDGSQLVGEGCWYAPQLSTIKSGLKCFYRTEERAVKERNKIHPEHLNKSNENIVNTEKTKADSEVES